MPTYDDITKTSLAVVQQKDMMEQLYPSLPDDLTRAVSIKKQLVDSGVAQRTTVSENNPYKAPNVITSGSELFQPGEYKNRTEFVAAGAALVETVQKSTELNYTMDATTRAMYYMEQGMQAKRTLDVAYMHKVIQAGFGKKLVAGRDSAGAEIQHKHVAEEYLHEYKNFNKQPHVIEVDYDGAGGGTPTRLTMEKLNRVRGIFNQTFHSTNYGVTLLIPISAEQDLINLPQMVNSSFIGDGGNRPLQSNIANLPYGIQSVVLTDFLPGAKGFDGSAWGTYAPLREHTEHFADYYNFTSSGAIQRVSKPNPVVPSNEIWALAIATPRIGGEFSPVFTEGFEHEMMIKHWDDSDNGRKYVEREQLSFVTKSALWRNNSSSFIIIKMKKEADDIINI